MRKIQLKLFDRRRNQNFWFHFCYIPMNLWEKYQSKFQVLNMDNHIKEWIKQDFGYDMVTMEDMVKAKNSIKSIYAEQYPDIYLDSEGDRQGWVRVWLSDKITKLLEVK